MVRLVNLKKEASNLQQIQSRKSLKVTPNKNIKIVVDKPVDLKSMSREEKKEVHNIVNKIIKDNYTEEKNL